MSSTMLRTAAIALSLANLCFMFVWHELILDRRNAYFLENPHHDSYFVAALLNVLLLAVAVATILRPGQFLTTETASPVRRTVFVALWVIPLAYLRRELPGDRLEAALGRIPYLGLAALLAAGCGYLLWRYRSKLAQIGCHLALVLLPFTVVTFAQALKPILMPAPSEPARAAHVQPIRQKATDGRVLWFIFDAFDQHLAFDHRPPTVALPELDRFRQTALIASQAYPPAPATLLSIPALLTGQLVSWARPAGANELRLTLEGSGETVGWSTLPNVFSRARALGYRTGLVGGYHPYCRVLGQALDSCHAQTVFSGAQELPVGQFMYEQAHRVLANIPVIGRFMHAMPPFTLEDSIRVHQNHHAAAKALLDVNGPDFVFVHWSIPHPAGIYNRFEGRLAKSADPHRASYLDNLALVDRTLGEVRQQLERTGQWRETTVLISSDHWLRHTPELELETKQAMSLTEHRIPFLLKMAGQERAVAYAQPFNTVLSQDLLLSIMQGTVDTPDDAVRWLDEHRSIADSPINLDPLWRHRGEL